MSKTTISTWQTKNVEYSNSWTNLKYERCWSPFWMIEKEVSATKDSVTSKRCSMMSIKTFSMLSNARLMVEYIYQKILRISIWQTKKHEYSKLSQQQLPSPRETIMAKSNRKSRQGVHSHTPKNADCSCFICKAAGNRTFKQVALTINKLVMVCRSCRQSNGL